MDLNKKQIHILNIAEKLFAENGFDGTSVRTIAKEANVNVTMISYYFGSKEKLLAAFLLYRISSFKKQLQKVIEQEKPYEEVLEELVEMIVYRMCHKRRLYKIIHFEYSNQNRGLNFKAYTEEKIETFKLIKSFIEKGQADGVFKKNVTVELIMPTVQGTFFNFYYNKRFYKALIPIENTEDFDIYVHQTLTKHIKQVVKSLLLKNEI